MTAIVLAPPKVRENKERDNECHNHHKTMSEKVLFFPLFVMPMASTVTVLVIDTSKYGHLS